MELFEYLDRLWPVIVVLWLLLSRVAGYLKRARARQAAGEDRTREAEPARRESVYEEASPYAPEAEDEVAHERGPSLYELLGVAPTEEAAEEGESGRYEPAAESYEEVPEEGVSLWAPDRTSAEPEAAPEEAVDWEKLDAVRPVWRPTRPVPALSRVDRGITFDHSPQALRDAIILQALMRPVWRR